MSKKNEFYQKFLYDQINIPRKLLTHYTDLNLMENDLVVILQIIRFQTNGNLFPSITEISQVMSLKEHEIAQILRNLMQKGFILIEQHKENDIIFESYSLEPLLKKLYESDQKERKSVMENNLFILFEQEFGRALSPIEIEMINHWLDDDQLSPALIKAALREAVLMAKLNFRYIDRILNEWIKKGVKTVEDARKTSQAFHSKSNTQPNYSKKEKRDTSVYYDWLNED
jgi:DNA replication protein